MFQKTLEYHTHALKHTHTHAHTHTHTHTHTHKYKYTHAHRTLFSSSPPALHFPQPHFNLSVLLSVCILEVSPYSRSVTVSVQCTCVVCSLFFRYFFFDIFFLLRVCIIEVLSVLLSVRILDVSAYPCWICMFRYR